MPVAAVQMAPPMLPSTLSSSSLSSVARGKKRARFADDEKPPRDEGGVLQPVFKSEEDAKPYSEPRKVAKAKKGQTSPTSGIASMLADNGPMRRSMYMAVLEKAFAEKHAGRMERYNEILAQFQPFVNAAFLEDRGPSASADIAQIQTWLSALMGVVSRLDRSHTVLVDTVLGLPWTIMDDSFVGSYTRFVCSLVSARGEWVKLVADKLIRGFQYRSIPLEARSSLLPSDVSRKTIYARSHTLLRHLLSLIPTLPSTLWPLLEVRFPSKRDNRDAHVCYISNLLRIMFYCPALEENILELIVGRAIKLDVEIQVEVEDWEDEDGHLEIEIFGKSVDDAFDKKWADEEASDDEGEMLDEGLNFDDLSSEGGDLSDDEDEKAQSGPDEASIRKVKELAAKLDAILRCVFDHLQQMNSAQSPTTFSAPSSDRPSPRLLSSSYASSFSAMSPVLFDSSTDEGHGYRKKVFDVLLILFERHILCTHRTRHTQFILFWYASLDPQFTDDFLGLLVEAALFDESVPVVTRVAATGYVASLVGRARYIERDSARHVMKLLCARLDADLNRFGTVSVVDVNGKETTGQQYATWYSIAQAAFYIFCFRWKDLMEQEDEDEDDPVLAIRTGRWMPALKVLERAVSSHLNPLKACAPTVVSQFARISQQVDFLYCYGIIRSNDRLGMSASASMHSLNDPSRPGTPSSDLAASRTSLNGMARAAVPPPTANPLVRQVLAETKMDSFFPFDPFKLPLTEPYLKHIYRVWDGGPRGEEDSDDDDGSSSDEGDADDVERAADDSPIGGSPAEGTLPIPMARRSSDDEKLDSGLAGMSISPRPAAPLSFGAAMSSV